MFMFTECIRPDSTRERRPSKEPTKVLVPAVWPPGRLCTGWPRYRVEEAHRRCREYRAHGVRGAEQRRRPQGLYTEVIEYYNMVGVSKPFSIDNKRVNYYISPRLSLQCIILER